ncbi:IucA/IucC family protein, partial [Georgenia alba]
EQKKTWVKRQAETTIAFHKKKQPVSFIQFLKLLSECRRFDELVYSEALVIEGHPLHPSTKTKLGLSKEEVLHYAPEFEREIMLKTVLVHTSLTVTSEGGKPMLYKECPAVERAAEHILSSLGEKMESYHPFLLHPWQYEHVLPQAFAAELSERTIIPLPVEIPSSATLSFRTMALTGMNVHAKLPVNVQATSAVRTVSP